MLASHLKLLAQMTACAAAGMLIYFAPGLYQRQVEKVRSGHAGRSTRGKCVICQGTEQVMCLACGGKGERLLLTTVNAWGNSAGAGSRPPLCDSCHGSGKVFCAACSQD